MATVKPEPVDDPGCGVTAAVKEGGSARETPNADSNNHGASPLQKLIVPGNPPELLERGVEIGLQVLASLKTPLADMTNSASGAQWLQSVNQLESLAKPARTIVGVVGNTGAGKSSVISAVLDEERYVDIDRGFTSSA